MPTNIFSNDLRLTSPQWKEYGSPFSTYARTLYPTTLEEVFNWCTPAGTMVDRDAYGNRTQIENLVVGDTVLSADAKTYPIDKAESRLVDEDVMRIRAAGIHGSDLVITKEHPLLAWRPTKSKSPAELDFSKADTEQQYVKAGEIQVGDWLCYPRPTYSETTTNFPYSPFIVGMYIAEGCLLKHYLVDGIRYARGVQFTLGSHETTLIDKLMTELTEYCGVAPVCYRPLGRADIVQIQIYDPELVGWLGANIGELCGGKRLPECVFHLPIDARLSLLGAWLDGDGYVYNTPKDGSVWDIAADISSMSFELIYQGMLLAQSCGLNPTLSRYVGENKSTKAFSHMRNETRIRFPRADMTALRPHVTKIVNPILPEISKRGNGVVPAGTMLWKRVERVEQERFTGLVYNIRVTTTHNYIVNGLVCHNCEWLWLHQGIYSKAIERMVRYFLTKVEIYGTTDYKVRRKYQDWLTDTLGIMSTLAMVGDDYWCFGNSFSSIYKSFHRNLVCPIEKCSHMQPADKAEYVFSGFKFTGICPACRNKVTFKIKDMPAQNDELRVVRWNQRSIEIEYDVVSGKKRFYYEPRAKTKAAINNGERVTVENMPEEMLTCLAKDEKFLFKEGEIYHMAKPVPASFIEDTAGWGLPPFLPNFEYVVQLQMLTKYHEAIMMDYLVPTRFFSPAKSGGDLGDPLLNVDSGRFMRTIENFWRQRRKDPTFIGSIPFPVNYQAIGGEAKNLAPTELLQFAVDMLLSSMGVPQEFYKETLATGGPPIGLRMFERGHTPFVAELNKYLDWIMGKCSEYLMWEDVRARLVKTSVMEDDVVRQTKLQMLSVNKVSNQTALAAFNIDYEYEVDKILEEQAMMDEKTQEMQRAKQQSDQAQQSLDQPLPSAQPPGGAPGGQPQQGQPQQGQPQQSGAPAGGTLEDMDMQADQQAQQILTMPPPERRSALLQIGKANDGMHALVVQKLKNYESRAAQTGINLTRAGQIPAGGQQQQQ